MWRPDGDRLLGLRRRRDRGSNLRQRPILIEGTDVVPQQIVPDHDQTVHLATP